MTLLKEQHCFPMYMQREELKLSFPAQIRLDSYFQKTENYMINAICSIPPLFLIESLKEFWE